MIAGGRDLKEIWREAVREEKLLYKTERDGTSWVAGLTISPDGEDIEPFILNESTGKFETAAVEKKVGRYVVVFDKVRALRPGVRKYPAPGPQPDLPKESRGWVSFSFDKGLASFTLPHAVWQLHTNIAPIEKEGHFLLVPLEEKKISSAPQILTKKSFEDFLALAGTTKDARLYFNGLHAGASVNRIHFQIVHAKGKTILEKAPTAKEKGLSFLDYPATVLVFDASEGEKAWQILKKFIALDIPLNIIAAKDRFFVIPRERKEEVVKGFKQCVLGSMDFSGRIVVENEETFNHATEKEIERVFKKTTLSKKRVIEAIN